MKNENKVCIENKILLLIVVIAIIFILKNLFILLKTTSLFFIIVDLLSLMIYALAIFGLLKNNKSWAWIIVSIPILFNLLNPLKPNFQMADSFTYSYGTVIVLFQAIFNSDPQIAIRKAIESVIPMIILLFIMINIFRFRKKTSA